MTRKSNKLTVLITGTASGIGKAVAQHFLSLGHAVVGVDIVESQLDGEYKGYIASITDTESLLRVCEKLRAENIELDAVINIAGIHAMASLVESDFAVMEKVIQVNLIGTMNANKAFYPLLKKKGRIIIVTSEVAGFDPMPFNGLYSVSKTALDCYAQALRQELNLLGQKVITIRPGAVQTALCDGSLIATENLARDTELYKTQAKHFLSITKKFMGKPMSAHAFAKTVYKATVARHPKLNYNKHRNLGLILLNALPLSWQCAIIKLLLNRNGSAPKSN